MTWLNIFIPNLRAAEFANSDPSARSTWLSLLAFCCEQENSGVIYGAESWTDRAWLQTCGVTADEVRKSAPLVTFENGDAKIWNYPEDKEKEVQMKRKAGKRGGLAKAANRGAASCATSSATRLLEPVLVAEPLAVLLRKGREEEVEGNEKGMEKEPPKPPATPKLKADTCPTTETAKRIADIFKRRHSTPWTEKEIAAFKKLGAIEGEDLRAVERYYASNCEFLRHDLGTFLNNFFGEVDRARKFTTKAATEIPRGQVVAKAPICHT